MRAWPRGAALLILAAIGTAVLVVAATWAAAPPPRRGFALLVGCVLTVATYVILSAIERRHHG